MRKKRDRAAKTIGAMNDRGLIPTIKDAGADKNRLSLEKACVLVPAPGEGRYITILESSGPLYWHVSDIKTGEVLEEWKKDTIFSEPVCLREKKK